MDLFSNMMTERFELSEEEMSSIINSYIVGVYVFRDHRSLQFTGADRSI